MNIWQCQFEKPTMNRLLKELSGDDRTRFASLRRIVREITHHKPKLEWQGLTWCWSERTLVDEGRFLHEIHLVPDPVNPRVAVTLSTVFFEKHPPNTLPKALYAGLNTATAIGHQCWCEFLVTSDESVEALSELLTLSHGD